MPVDPQSFRLSFLVGDLLRDGSEDEPLPKLTLEERDQIRQQLSALKTRRELSGELSNDQSLRINRILNKQMERLNDCKNAETTLSSLPEHPRIEPMIFHASSEQEEKIVVNEKEAPSDSGSIYEDASEISENSVNDDISNAASHPLPPSPADPVLELLEQACAVLRERPDVQEPSEKLIALDPPTVKATDTKVSKTSRDTLAEPLNDDRVTQVRGSWKVFEITLWRLFFVVWCLWEISDVVEARISGLVFLFHGVRGLAGSILGSFLRLFDGVVAAYLGSSRNFSTPQAGSGL
ncbi:uncharacterized protein LY89DRAFT_728787 [Mollisia scopiformis]|uniref:Uncharacterized protein n=1 Tax=Mollisia scopiformis TaxID=149040 RepID=A0A194XR52_MOLSC|nr:uncharacterized protein LY89DRAFT_728787 [Mollisia scopiformis]KUJ22668.1 hypothetical protein LY89DRAFT_728787 [Mollisia scopiformis]